MRLHLWNPSNDNQADPSKKAKDTSKKSKAQKMNLSDPSEKSDREWEKSDREWKNPKHALKKSDREWKDPKRDPKKSNRDQKKSKGHIFLLKCHGTRYYVTFIAVNAQGVSQMSVPVALLCG